jgi:uncharacterized protein (DUF169 family)
MTDFARLEKTLTTVLQLTRRPVAVAFRDAAPPGVEAFAGVEPSGCSFWRLAAEGRVFYTLPPDHYNCPVGSYTHNIPLPAAREPELMETLSLMSGLGYIRMEEVSFIPKLPRTPAFTVYAPLGATPVDPDVVVMTGTPGRSMLLHEAALRASRTMLPMLSRPTCMAIPAALAGGVASSLGCVGNRIYTDTTDDEYYTVVAGCDLLLIVEEMEAVVSANATLAEYHRSRRASLASV